MKIAKFFPFFIGLLLIPAIAFSANTHSADLERGSSQYLSRADSALFTSDDWTIEAWVKLESQPSTNNSNHIASKLLGGSGDTAEFILKYRDAGGTKQIVLAWQDGVNPAWEVVVNTTITTGTWTHVKGTRVRSTGRMIVYVNGTDVGNSASNTGATPNTDRSFAIGYADYGGAAEFLDGLVEEVRFWSTASSSLAYTECAVGNESGLVGRWSLDNTLNDSTANTLTLTNNNSVTFSTDVPASLPCGGASGSSGGTTWFLGYSSPVFDFFITNYYNALVILASCLWLLAMVTVLVRFNHSFKEWFRRKINRF